ncbi:MAG TPA: metallophosphoesterase family protein [Methylovirgula sp.]
MLIALFSDIHSNREALEACLADARKRGAERLVFLGDLVGYGPDPAYVVDRLMQLRREGAVIIKGNHDAAITKTRDVMSSHARTAIAWTRERLDPAQKDFLANLPLSVAWNDTLFVHAEASQPAQWIYIAGMRDAERSMRAAGHRITISGHVHRPRVFHMSEKTAAATLVPRTDVAIPFEKNRKWHAIIGSVGQPRDEIPSAAYALYDDAENVITFVRADYDIETTARKIRDAGLPEFLSQRLFAGH